MEQIELEVVSWEVLGKKVRFLRRQGITPVHLFGRGIESMALQCGTPELRRVLAEAGQTRLISLKLSGEKTPRTVMVREVQRETLTGKSLHVDFYQVKMEEQVKVEIPVIFVGESPALKLKENMLVHDLTNLTVECLPAQIPASVELDVGSLTEVEQTIRVGDINLGEGVAILNDPEQIVVKIVLRHIERVEEVAVVAEEEGEAVVEAAEAAPSSKEGAKE